MTDISIGQEGGEAMRRTPSYRSRKAILVSADVELLDILKAVFIEEARLHVITTTTPELVMHLIEATLPEVVLLDVSLPEQRGWEILTALRRQPRFSELPVLILAASHQDRQQLAAQNDPWVELLFQPFDLDVVLQRIQLLIQQQEEASGERQQSETKALGGKLLPLVVSWLHLGGVGK
jgi:DNA-binding response OmpR family regulator